MEENFMHFAIKEAKKALKKNEVPVGAVIVKNNEIISMAHNKTEKNKTATNHAEILAIKKASKKLGDWRLNDCEIYVTLEPCCMCSGAIINSRIKKVVFGAYDTNMGCAGGACNVFKFEKLNFKGEIIGGVNEEECASLLKQFFKSKR